MYVDTKPDTRTARGAGEQHKNVYQVEEGDEVQGPLVIGPVKHRKLWKYLIKDEKAMSAAPKGRGTVITCETR